ncbi:MAG: hypothetical protein PHT07_10450 [Paludibacter sp.]|nr:hypothetical protein [Paludibacter sp.]
MQPLFPNLTFEQLRQAKKNAQSSLGALGIDLTSSTIGNHVANIFGYHDWNAASAITKKNSTVSSMASNVAYNASITQATKTEPLLYQFRKPKRSGIMDYYRELVNHELSFSEENLWNAKDIHFVPTESNALFGVTGHGKTFIMLDWANALISDPKGMPFVYFLKQGHFMRGENGNLKMYDASEDVQARIVPIESYPIGQRSAVFAIPDDMEYSIILNALRSAMRHGYHVFIDENKFLFEMLDEVVNAGYKNFTVAIQPVRELFEHNMDEISKYAFTNILIGKQLDLGSDRYFQHMNIDIEQKELSNLNKGQFFWAHAQ